jgi:hypothetical protein
MGEADSGRNVAYDFKFVMDLIMSDDQPIEKYKDAFSRLNILEGMTLDAAKKHGVDKQKLTKNAECLVEESGGDILPALDRLGRFTYKQDPRFSDDLKPGYLEALLCWTFTAKRYLEPVLKYKQASKNPNEPKKADR